MNKYRLVEGIGQYFNKRWEVQERYSYYENGKKVESWHTVFTCKDKSRCKEVLNRYITEPKKDHRLPFTKDVIAMWQ